MGSRVGASVVVELFVVVVTVLVPGVLAAGPVEVTSVELSVGVVMGPGVSVVGSTGGV